MAGVSRLDRCRNSVISEKLQVEPPGLRIYAAMVRTRPAATPNPVSEVALSEDTGKETKGPSEGWLKGDTSRRWPV